MLDGTHTLFSHIHYMDSTLNWNRNLILQLATCWKKCWPIWHHCLVLRTDVNENIHTDVMNKASIFSTMPKELNWSPKLLSIPSPSFSTGCLMSLCLKCLPVWVCVLLSFQGFMCLSAHIFLHQCTSSFFCVCVHVYVCGLRHAKCIYLH